MTIVRSTGEAPGCYIAPPSRMGGKMKLISLLAAAILVISATGAMAQGGTRYVRYEHQGSVSYGILEGETIHELSGAPFDAARRTGAMRQLSAVRLLAPTAPDKVIAVGFNYIRHLPV